MKEYNMEQQFLELLQIVERLQNQVVSLEKTNQVLVRSNRQLIDVLEEQKKELADYQSNLYYEINDTRAREACWYPMIESIDETIEEIVNGKSLARFGDGEFSVIAGRVRHKFQTESDLGLAERLKEVLESEEEKLVIGLADNYGSLEMYNEQAKREIRRYLNREVRLEHLSLLNPERVYGNAYVTRPYVMYMDNGTDAPGERFRNLKRIWQDRRCIIVEGAQTGLGIGNNLFENAKSISRILGPAENAFHQYDSILKECLRQEKDVLFLLALGPTATVLAYDLCRAGYQAVDVGHVDLEYEWYLKGEGCRTEVYGKYNNEVADGENPVDIAHIAYQGQVVADFS